MPKPKKDYVVKGGDSLTKIAKEVYGDPRMFAEIQRNNPWYNGVLRPGQVLKLPGKRSNPFVSNTEAAAAGMLGGTAETGYGFTGDRAGELNALSSGVRDTGRQINPNTPWGFNQATQLAQQYYGGAGSQVGAPPAPAPSAAQMAATPTTQQQAQGGGMAQQYFNQAQQATQPKTPSVVSAPGTGWGSPLQNSQTAAPAASTFAQGGARPGVTPSINPAAKPYTPPAQPVGSTTPATSGITPQGSAPGGLGWGSPVQGAHYDYQTAGAVITSIVAGAGPSVVSAMDLYGISNGAGLDPTAVAQDMMAKGYRFDPDTRSMYKPDSALASLGVPSLSLGMPAPSEFVGLPPVTPPSNYGPPRPIYTGGGRKQTGLATPALLQAGTQSANWNIGP